MRIVALAFSFVFIAACAGTPAAAPAPTAIPTTGGTTVPTVTATATQAAATAATTALNCTAPAQPLVELTEGPYYKAGAPERASLVATGVVGTRFVLTGYVVSRSCQPMANARLDFWQADGNGNYDNSGYTLRGYQMTDTKGAYRLETVIPGLYPGRTEHIHFKVTVNGRSYTSQLFFPDVAGNAADSIYRAQMVVKMDKTTNPISGTFTFVVNIA